MGWWGELRVCVCAYMNECVCVCVCEFMHVLSGVWPGCSCLTASKHTYTHINTHARTHIYIHIHSLSRSCRAFSRLRSSGSGKW